MNPLQQQQKIKDGDLGNNKTKPNKSLLEKQETMSVQRQEKGNRKWGYVKCRQDSGRQKF